MAAVDDPIDFADWFEEEHGDMGVGAATGMPQAGTTAQQRSLP
jgi:hypothetical protein